MLQEVQPWERGFTLTYYDSVVADTGYQPVNCAAYVVAAGYKTKVVQPYIYTHGNPVPQTWSAMFTGVVIR